MLSPIRQILIFTLPLVRYRKSALAFSPQSLTFGRLIKINIRANQQALFADNKVL